MSTKDLLDAQRKQRHVQGSGRLVALIRAYVSDIEVHLGGLSTAAATGRTLDELQHGEALLRRAVARIENAKMSAPTAAEQVLLERCGPSCPGCGRPMPPAEQAAAAGWGEIIARGEWHCPACRVSEFRTARMDHVLMSPPPGAAGHPLMSVLGADGSFDDGPETRHRFDRVESEVPPTISDPPGDGDPGARKGEA